MDCGSWTVADSGTTSRPLTPKDDAVSAVKILYLMGAGRSGTTLLSRLLDLEDDHRAIGEIKYLGSKKTWALPCGCGLIHTDCSVWGPLIGVWADPSRLAAWEDALRIGRWNATLLARSAPPSAALASGLAEVRRVYESLAEPGTVLVDESKRPWLGQVLATQSWADVSFVELVRNPDDVVRSWSKGKGYLNVLPAEEVTKSWLRKHGGAEIMRRRLRRPWLRVPYEQLANSPQEALSTVMQRPPTRLHWDGSSWGFVGQENHIYLSNSDKLRRGPDAVRAISPGSRSVEASDRGPYQRLAGRYYRHLLQGQTTSRGWG